MKDADADMALTGILTLTETETSEVRKEDLIWTQEMKDADMDTEILIFSIIKKDKYSPYNVEASKNYKIITSKIEILQYDKILMQYFLYFPKNPK